MKLQLVKIQPGFRALALSAAVLLTLGSSVLAADAPESWVRLDVPFVPTPPIVMEAMLKAASVGANDVLYDLGSGDGRIAIAAARAYGVKKPSASISTPNASPRPRRTPRPRVWRTA